jgi:hypothetical protein
MADKKTGGKKMKKIIYFFVAAVVIFILFSINRCSSETTVNDFNAKPSACGIISNSLSIVPQVKLEKKYKWEINVYLEYSPVKHLEKHPEDVVIQTSIGKGEVIVVILTNDDPYNQNYFVSENVALTKKQ